MTQIWSTDEIEYQLNLAARTLRHMRLGGHGIPSNRVTFWPEVVRDAVEAYGYNEETPKRGRPSSTDIDSMDRAICWLLILSKDERMIVWARCERMPWTWMANADESGRLSQGRSIYLLKKIYYDSIDRIRAHANGPIIASLINQTWSRGTAA